jgi:hypothetical protein
MKYKIILFLSLCFLPSLLIGNRQNLINNPLTLQNIEALSLGESDYIYCLGIGSIDCPWKKEKVFYYNSSR